MRSPLRAATAPETSRIEVVGAATPEVVWARYEPPDRWAEWAPHIRRVRADGELIAPGVTGRVHSFGPVSIDFEITAVDPAARTWSWTVRRGPLRLDLTHDVAAAEGGCRAGLDVTGPVALVRSYLPAAAWALRSLVTP